MFLQLTGQSSANVDFLNLTFRKIIENTELFKNRSDFRILCSLKAYDAIILMKEVPDTEEFDLLRDFNNSFIERAKYVSWGLQAVFFTILIYFILNLPNYKPEIIDLINKYDFAFTIFGAFGLTVLGNIIPVVRHKSIELTMLIFGYKKVKLGNMDHFEYEITDQDRYKTQLSSAIEILEREIFPESESIFCSIHSSFHDESGPDHNCIGCNLADGTALLLDALKAFKAGDNISVFTAAILYSYLLVERILVLQKIIDPEKRDSSNSTFQIIRRWANFIKHPKAFMLVHHPRYYSEHDPEIPTSDTYHLKIDQPFIDKYYSGPSNNDILYSTLTNAKNVIVVLPEIDKLMASFCRELNNFIFTISQDASIRERLAEKSTFRNYFENETEL